VLVVRTIQSDLLPELVEKWRGEWPGAVIDALTHRGQHNDLSCFDDVFEYTESSDFSWTSVFDLMPWMRSYYDLAIIPHHQAELEGFENVILMLALFGIKQWAHCGPDGVLRPVSKLRALRAAASGLAALGPAAALYLGYIVTLLLAERTRRNGL
jgi:hypothetical protein